MINMWVAGIRGVSREVVHRTRIQRYIFWKIYPPPWVEAVTVMKERKKEKNKGKHDKGVQGLKREKRLIGEKIPSRGRLGKIIKFQNIYPCTDSKAEMVR